MGAFEEHLPLTRRGTGPPAVGGGCASGYDAAFLGERVDAPVPLDRVAAAVLDYTHFTVTMHPQRRLAWSVAWNVDGLRLLPGIRRPTRFTADARLPLDQQTTEAVYADNDLDRGHLARRADLLWGTLEEAKQANVDSFCFTNISPQLAAFNQASRGGVWGELELGVLELEQLVDRRISVFAGPVLATDDPPYRGLVQLPREHWKVVVYRMGDRLRSKAFLLTQDLDGLPGAYLDEFHVFEVSLNLVADRTGLDLAGIPRKTPAAVVGAARDRSPREIAALDAISW